MAVEGASSLWLVPAGTVGVEVGANFIRYARQRLAADDCPPGRCAHIR